MTRHRLLIAPTLCLLLLAGCVNVGPMHKDIEVPANEPSASTQGANESDARFARFSADFLEGWLALNPVTATQLGEHRHDGELDDLSAAGRARTVAFAERMLTGLDTIDVSTLSRDNQVDALILRNQLESDRWSMQTLQAWRWDPQMYTQLAGGSIYNLMAREYAPLPQRLAAATARIEKLPGLFAQMRENIEVARVPAIHAETVAKQHAGVLSLVDQFLTPNAGKLAGDERARFDRAIATLRIAVAEHQTWLDETLVPGARGDFRLGAALYDQKLAYALMSSLSRAEIKQRAEAELARVRSEMYALARKVLKDRPGAPPLPEAPAPAQQQAAIEAALELAYADKPGRQEVVDYAKQTLVEATAFVRAKDLVTVPDAPVKIILMPEFQRGIAIAYADSPGPLDKGLDTYYALSPIPDDWTDEQVDSLLREYNKKMMHVLTIHEAMPGHYLEGAHSVKHPSILRAVLRSGLFAEGWAVYTERMMADAGYLDFDPLFRLMQLKFYARAVANSILDQGVHVDGWSEQQAMDLLVRGTFQQEREAAGKWTRVRLTSAQLPTYFVGAQEFFELRRAVEAKEGAAFDAKLYHDAVLSHGAPPVRFARQLMLDEPVR